MRARIFAIAGIIAMAACSGDPTNVETRTITSPSGGDVIMVTTTGDAQDSGQMADNSWASATTGGTMDQYLNPNDWD